MFKSLMCYIYIYSSYESSLQCVTANLKSCDTETIRQVELDLQTAYAKIAADCVPMPDLVVSILCFY